MMNSTKGTARFVSGIGLLLSGPVLTMTMFQEALGVSYVFGVTDGLLVGFAMLIWSRGFQTISEDRSNT